MSIRVYQSGAGRPTLDTYAGPIIGARRLRNRAYSGFWLASVITALAVGFVIGLLI